MSSSNFLPLYNFFNPYNLLIYRLEKPSKLIVPRSPPDPLTYIIFSFLLVSGSFKSNFVEVLPPPKLVTCKSAPNKRER